MSKYREHNPRELGEYYTTHIMAMTAEKLYDKSAIAAELAYRDKCIAELEAEKQQYKTVAKKYKDRFIESSKSNAAYRAENQRLRDALEAILKINWGYDGDCGAARIAEQALEKET